MFKNNALRGTPVQQGRNHGGSQLRALGGADPARFWRAVGAAIAPRDSGKRSLRVANRVIVETLKEAVEPGRPCRADECEWR